MEGRAGGAGRRAGSDRGTGKLRRAPTVLGRGLHPVARKAFVAVCVSGVQTCLTGKSAAMTRRVPATVLIGAIAVLVVTVTSAVIAWRASSATITAGFWWDDVPFALSPDDVTKIGGPLTADELETIEAIS